MGASGAVTIGNNVFIGMNAIIMRNVTIGNNCIIGAGSVVVKDCPDNGVYAGNPATYIMSIQEYNEKREKLQVEEAVLLAQKYYQRYGKKPEKKIFHEYFMLFEKAADVRKQDVFANKMCLVNNEALSYKYMDSHNPVFASYEEFLEYCLKVNDTSKG